jgi:prevent-host-death family protein
MITVGAHEARTHLAKLIRAVEHGEAVIITRRGKPVAKLGPVEDQRQQMQEAIASIKRLRRRFQLTSLSRRYTRAISTDARIVTMTRRSVLR